MDANLPKTARVIELLEDVAELQALKATYLSGPYTPGHVLATVQDLTYEIAEMESEIVQIVRDLESASVQSC